MAIRDQHNNKSASSISVDAVNKCADQGERGLIYLNYLNKVIRICSRRRYDKHVYSYIVYFYLNYYVYRDFKRKKIKINI